MVCSNFWNLPLELFPLSLDSLQSKVSGLAPELDRCQLAALLIRHALKHLQLYRQSMTVPSRHISARHTSCWHLLGRLRLAVWVHVSEVAYIGQGSKHLRAGDRLCLERQSRLLLS